MSRTEVNIQIHPHSPNAGMPDHDVYMNGKRIGKISGDEFVDPSIDRSEFKEKTVYYPFALDDVLPEDLAEGIHLEIKGAKDMLWDPYTVEEAERMIEGAINKYLEDHREMFEILGFEI